MAWQLASCVGLNLRYGGHEGQHGASTAPSLLVTHESYWSHTHSTGHTPTLLVTPHHTAHTPIILITYTSYWSYTHPTGHTPIILLTNKSYWSHPILQLPHPSY